MEKAKGKKKETLGQMIRSAEKEMRTWPKWMRDSAKFEGAGQN